MVDIGPEPGKRARGAKIWNLTAVAASAGQSVAPTKSEQVRLVGHMDMVRIGVRELAIVCSYLDD